MEQRYIPNDYETLFTIQRPKAELLEQAIEELTKQCPPKDSYNYGKDGEALGGIFVGPTGLAYLFLHLSVSHPKLTVAGNSMSYWAERYIRPERLNLIIEKESCGILSEKLAYEAVRACISKDLSHVKAFVANMPALLTPRTTPAEDPFPSDLTYGRAGTLYLLRMIRHFVPNSAALLERSIVMVTERILASDDDGKGNWIWIGKRYIGAGHGDIGILTQLILTTPPLASQLAPRLEKLLDMQLEDGNFPKFEGSTESDLVQWCHGAPGFVMSLLSLRPFFPALQDRIDQAITRARDCIWKKGLIKKEPCLCHGILSNGFALGLGPQREHFLAFGTPEKMAEMRAANPELFQPAAYGSTNALWMNYWPSAIWTWAVCDKVAPRLIGYNDL